MVQELEFKSIFEAGKLDEFSKLLAQPVGDFQRILENKFDIQFQKEEQIVYDPFLGSGSTLIACEQTNRICYGMELDPHYTDVIIKRWENYTGKKAVKIS